MTAEDFAYAELAILREICTRDFSLYQRLVLFVILKYSFGRCLGKAYLPTLKAFFDVCGVPRTYVGETLRELKSLRVIGVDPEKPGCYGFNVLTDSWGVDVRVGGPVPQEQFYLAPDDLADALREVFVQNSKNDILRSVSILSAREQGATLFFRPEPGSTTQRAHASASLGEGSAPARQEPADTGGQSRPAQPAAITVLASDCPPRPEGSQEVSAAALSPGVPESGTGAVPENCTPAVPDSGTLWKKLKADAGLLDAVPDSGTPLKGFPPGTPLPKRLTVERSTLNAKRITRQEERRLMQLISEFVGIEDMKTNGGNFRVRWVRNGNMRAGGYTIGELIEEQVRFGTMLLKTSREYPFEKNEGAWLTRTLCLAAGVEQSAEMPVGAKPL